MSLDLASATLADLENHAAASLRSDAYAYYSTGARDEVTQRANPVAWESWSFAPRVLVDTSNVSLSTTVLGAPVASPIMIAPMAAHGLAHPDGELATARAAAAVGSLLVLSMSSTHTVEHVAATGVTFWMQLYLSRDRDLSRGLVARAVAAGARAIVLTVDSVLERSAHRRGPAPTFPPLPMNPGEPMETAPTWADVRELVNSAGVPVVLKGILTPADAVLAVDAGVAGIVVSNHGGRQLDRAVPTALVLADIVDAVAGRIEIYADSGIRRGADILTALALGARAVLVGRPVLWGLAVGGEAGVTRVLDVLTDELDQDARQAGVASLDAVPRSLVTRTR